MATVAEATKQLNRPGRFSWTRKKWSVVLSAASVSRSARARPRQLEVSARNLIGAELRERLGISLGWTGPPRSPKSPWVNLACASKGRSMSHAADGAGRRVPWRYGGAMTSWAEVFPPFGVRISCGDLELAALTPDDVPPLLDLAVDGIVPEASGYPFITGWALLPPEELRTNSAQFYFSTWAQARPSSWELLMVVKRQGEVIGAQDLRARDFATSRVAHTGSWLGRRFHGRGTGTLMRQLICAFAFDQLGAEQCRTEAYLDNPASQRVSEKAGYERFDLAPVDRLGERAEEVRFRLTPEALVRPAEPIRYEGVAPFKRFVGID